MPSKKKQLKLGAFLSVPGNHLAGWRHPDAVPDYDMDFSLYMRLAQTAERALYDTIFFQDTVAVAGSDALKAGDLTRTRLSRIVKLEPTATLAALAVGTKNIGLIATATTTFNEPYNIARRFSTIDHISGGRCGWNLVTSQIEDEAGNFNLDTHVDHALRYERAIEFYEVVAGLWDSWEHDAFLRDKESGVWFDREKMHFLDHHGKYFHVRGPLNSPRTPQGRPVVAQAGSSEPGRELAARTADIVFTAQTELEAARAFFADVKGRTARYGRTPDDIKIMPGITPVIGRTMEEAQEKYDALQALLPDDVALAALARFTRGIDIFSYDLNGPMPELPEANSAKSRQKLIMDMAKKHNMTLRQVARSVSAAQGHRVLVGTVGYIADQMQEWLEADACDGFNVICNYYPGPFDDFANQVIPELQRRGIFRTAYEGPTLRDNLGLRVPENRYTAARR
ncbi:LLM class flavin-dependent oxidoreductase [Roseomonas stagni]|uniref:LLM class flavin-dependent oxidoreductase n=1 Tax=Falsiroseomonas algicola TaxID=2716930 RepID=A0A6M1LI46_9PROT|nr:LLM class flavin-dependent oxidoreductase [Falsiroseomonas algicola]NGM20018.1 LLM class flavin-dependent oxidoreductase [Falsiroseomonas algicola]